MRERSLRIMALGEDGSAILDGMGQSAILNAVRALAMRACRF